MGDVQHQRSRQRYSSSPVRDDVDENEGDPEQQSTPSCCSRLIGMLQLIAAAVLYAYVFFKVVFILVVPASIDPLLYHMTVSPPNTSNVSKAMPLALHIAKNGGLLSLFVLQHTLMARCNLERLVDRVNLGPYSRLIYVCSTCMVMEVIHNFWQPISDHYLWHCGIRSWLFYTVMAMIHLLCWLSISCSVYVMDYLELIGVKQLYYSYKGWKAPIRHKSLDQQQLLRHMRHPVFLAPLVILWVVPTMTYDRVLLAVMVPMYLLWGSQVNEEDTVYINMMYEQKKRRLFAATSKKLY